MAEFEYIFGPHSVGAALEAGKRKIDEIYLLDKSKSHGNIKKAASKKRIKTIPVKKEYLSKIAGTKTHQGIVAKASPLELLDIGELFNIGFAKNPFVLILDSIEDPRNLGAIARSSLCLGVDAIIIPKDRSAGATPTASKVSAGALEHIPVISVTNIASSIEELKRNNYWVAGLAAEGEVDINDADISHPFALIVGSEGSGIRPLVQKKCDFLMRIYQKGPISSLNAGVAAAIAVYECIKKVKKD